MNNNKPWYEKVGIWVGIIAGICAILGISVFGSKSLIGNNKYDDTSVNLKDNEINMGDQSAIVFGDNNTFNYGHSETDNTIGEESNELYSSEADDFSVVASYDMNTVQSSPSGIDVLIKAETSFPADHVTISAISDETETKPIDMHGGTSEWYFKANFYIKGKYTVIVTAYNSDGESISDEFTYVY